VYSQQVRCRNRTSEKGAAAIAVRVSYTRACSYYPRLDVSSQQILSRISTSDGERNGKKLRGKGEKEFFFLGNLVLRKICGIIKCTLWSAAETKLKKIKRRIEDYLRTCISMYLRTSSLLSSGFTATRWFRRVSEQEDVKEQEKQVRRVGSLWE